MWVCEGCGTRYAEPLAACPHCGSGERHADYEEDEMPKVTAAGGPSNAAAEAPEVEALAAGAAPAAEEAPEPKAKSAAKAKAAKDAQQDG